MKPSRSWRPSVQNVLGVLGFLLSVTAFAQDPRIRARLEMPDTLWTGQKVTLVVELLAPGYFSGAASYDLPDPAGLLLFPPAEHPVVGGETIDGTYYVSQRYELAVYPSAAGPHTIPPIPVRIAYKRAPLDHDSISATVTTPALKLMVTAPPGTAGLGQVISARGLRVVDDWKPEPGTTPLKAGDAFTRTVTFTAPQVPGMVFPAFPAGKIDGLRLYPKAPALLDRTVRGDLEGGRRDTIVYVCERAGTFTIPAVRLTWWDLDGQRLRTADLPARTLVVAANPALATAPVAPAAVYGRSVQLEWLVSAAAVVVLLGWIGSRSAGARRVGRRLLAPLRPVHLQPLNPPPGEADPAGH